MRKSAHSTLHDRGRRRAATEMPSPVPCILMYKSAHARADPGERVGRRATSRATRRSIGMPRLRRAASESPASPSSSPRSRRPPAHADATVTELARDTPIAAYGGALAWSAYDAPGGPISAHDPARRGDGRSAGAERAARVRRQPRAGLPRAGRRAVHALSRGGAQGDSGAPVRRLPLDLRTRSERRLASVSSPSFDEVWPAQWRGRVAFARRGRTRVVSGYDHRPEPRRSGQSSTATSRTSRRCRRVHPAGAWIARSAGRRPASRSAARRSCMSPA